MPVNPRIAFCIFSSLLVAAMSLPGAVADEEWSETQDYVATGVVETGQTDCDDLSFPPAASFDLSGVDDEAWVLLEFDDAVFGVAPHLLCIDGGGGWWSAGTMEEQYYLIALSGSFDSVDIYVAQATTDPSGGGLGTTGTITATLSA